MMEELREEIMDNIREMGHMSDFFSQGDLADAITALVAKHIRDLQDAWEAGSNPD